MSHTKELLEYGPASCHFAGQRKNSQHVGTQGKALAIAQKNVFSRQWSNHKRCFSSSVWDQVRAHRGNNSLIIENFRHRKGAIGYDTLQENVEIFSRNLAFSY